MATLKSTQVIGDLFTAGFTSLGSDAPKIKMKKYTGTTGSAQGTEVMIAHGLTSAKVLLINALVEQATNVFIAPGEVGTTFAFSCYIDATNIVLRLGGSPYNGVSSSILSKPFRVTLIYEE